MQYDVRDACFLYEAKWVERKHSLSYDITHCVDCTTDLHKHNISKRLDYLHVDENKSMMTNDDLH